MKEKWKYALSGAAAGTANGLFGAGGGMILVPLLTRWAKLPDKKPLPPPSVSLPPCALYPL